MSYSLNKTLQMCTVKIESGLGYKSFKVRLQVQQSQVQVKQNRLKSGLEYYKSARMHVLFLPECLSSLLMSKFLAAYVAFFVPNLTWTFFQQVFRCVLSTDVHYFFPKYVVLKLVVRQYARYV